MTLHVDTSGAGRDLFLIHGWGMHGGVWENVTQGLAQHFRVHAIDLPGMGHSPACSPYTLERLAQAVAEQLPDDALLCGWSLGGLLAMRLALAQPHKVSRLALVGATPRFVNGDGWQCGVEADVFQLFAGQVEDDYPGTMDRFLGLQAFGGESSRATIRQLRARFLLRPAPERQVLHAALQILLTSDLRDEVAQLRQPLLLLHGERDTLAPVAAAHWLAQQLPQSELRVIAGSAHAPFLSHPTAFVQALTDFMG